VLLQMKMVFNAVVVVVAQLGRNQVELVTLALLLLWVKGDNYGIRNH
jgi:hypothetical protein